MLCCSNTSGTTSTGKQSRASGRGPLLQDGPSPLPGLSAKKSILEGTAGLLRMSHPSHFAMGIKKLLFKKNRHVCTSCYFKKEGGLSLPLLTVPSLKAALPVSWPFPSEFAFQEESASEALFLVLP